MENAPVHLLRFIYNLLSKDIDNSLLNDISENYTDGKWSKEIQQRGIFIDLSQIRSADLGATTQLVLFIEDALKNNVHVSIALPCLKLFEKNVNNYFEDNDNFLKQRINVSNFLVKIKFHEAVLCNHLKLTEKVFLTNKFQPLFNKDIKLSLDEYKELTKKNNPIDYCQNTKIKFRSDTYKMVFPLTWLNSEKDFFTKQEQKTLFENILYEENTGKSLIEPLDLKDIEHTILLELLKNVKEHAGKTTKYALYSMGIAIVDNKANKSTYRPHYEYETEYLDLIKSREIKHIIEICFGDTGCGILNEKFMKSYDKCANKKQSSDPTDFDYLEWAFDKWSTSKTKETNKTRGTKGLYRIQRLVDRYDGTVTIRNKKAHGSFVKTKNKISAWKDNSANPEKYIYRNGTYIQFYLCPLKESLKYNFKFRKNSEYARNWKLFNCIFTTPNEKNKNREKSDGIIKTFKSALQTKIEQGNDLIVILDVDEKSLKNLGDKKEIELKHIFEECLFHLAYVRHPTRIMVYIAYDQGNQTIETYANSASARIKKELKSNELKKHEKIYDPVVVIGKNNNIFWYGGNQTLSKILEELSEINNDVFELNESSTYKKLSYGDKKSIESALKSDKNYITIEESNITFNFFNIPESSKNQLEKNFKGVVESSQNTVSPKLKLISQWVNVNDITENYEFFYALQLSFLIKRKEPSKNIKPETKILIDNQIQYKITKEIAKLIGINSVDDCIKNLQNDIDYQIPKRTRLFNKGEDVIIFTTIISSSETIRRMVKQIRRDEANVLFIICLANLRKQKITKMETWGKTSNIYSLYQKYNEDESEQSEDFDKKLKCLADKFTNLAEDITLIKRDFRKDSVINNKNSKNGKIEFLKKHEAQIDTNIKKYLQKTKSLHYGHYGEFNQRHFTFFLNKEKILTPNVLDPSINEIWEKFKEKIQNWIDNNPNLFLNNNETPISLILPQKDKSSNLSLLKVADYLAKEFSIVNNEIISLGDLKNKPPKSNLIYLDFGSLTGGSINKVISGISNVNSILICILFSQLQEKDTKFYQRIKSITDDNNNSIKVDIEYIDKLPLRYYNSTNCPICEHVRALEKFKGENQYLIDFANDRKNKIQIKDKTLIGNVPTDFYTKNGNQEDYELSSEIIMQMFILNLLISKANNSTLYRTKLFNYIYSVYKDRNALIQKPNSKIYALLYLLGNEVYLLQREPLIFRVMRKMLTQISLSVLNLKFETLVKHFDTEDNRKQYSINAEKLATRYKFAAITILRSANKHEFCNNVFKIIENSIKTDNKLSNNLIQNTFFHINSIHKNSYNSSFSYFDLLDASLDKLFKELNTKFTFESKLLLHHTILVNKRLRKKSNILEELKTDMDIIKSLKKEVKSKYGNGNNHPDALECFREMSLIDQESEIIEGYIYEEEAVEQTLSNIVDNWLITSSFLEEILNVYVCKLSNNLLDSKLFEETYFKKHVVTNRLVEKFTDSVYAIVYKDRNGLTSDIHSHNLLYNYILQFLLSKDSKLQMIIKQYPTNVINLLNSFKDNNNGFKDICIDIKDIGKTKSSIFYPTSSFERLLKSIKKNIKDRINSTSKLDRITINIKVFNERRFIIIEIKNDFTLENIGQHNGNNGALNRFKKDIVLHGGDLEYGSDDNNEYFVLTIKFLKY